MTNKDKDKIEVFIAYAREREDEELLKQIETQLRDMELDGLIAIWYPGKVPPGYERIPMIKEHLDQASLILFLVSAEFIASEECRKIVERAMERRANEGIIVIPVLLRASSWQYSKFKNLEPLPKNGKPINSWPNRSNALQEISNGIRELVALVEERRSKSAANPPTSHSSQSQNPGENLTPFSAEVKTMANTTFSNGYALLIGVGADLPITVKDATALYDVLTNPARAAYPEKQVQLLTETKATRQDIFDAFDKLIAQTNSNPNATVIVYFSGHGGRILNDGKPTEYFLVPYRYNQNKRAETTISGVEFTNKIEAIKASKLIVLLDCCHADGIPSLKAIGETFEKSPLPLDLVNKLETGSGRIVVASSRKEESSLIFEGDPNSIFTVCLLEALAGKGKILAERDGYAYMLDIITYLLRRVPRRTSDAQHPILNDARQLEDFPLCYYAGGSKELSDETSVPLLAPEPQNTQYARPVVSARRKALVERQESLLDDITETEKALDAARGNPVLRSDLEKEIKRLKKVLDGVKDELRNIE